LRGDEASHDGGRAERQANRDAAQRATGHHGQANAVQQRYSGYGGGGVRSYNSGYAGGYAGGGYGGYPYGSAAGYRGYAYDEDNAYQQYVPSEQYRQCANYAAQQQYEDSAAQANYYNWAAANSYKGKHHDVLITGGNDGLIDDRFYFLKQ